MLCRALNELNDNDAKSQPRVLIAMDDKAEAGPRAGALPRVSVEVFGGNRLEFVGRAIAIALRQRIDLLLIGHVNYAPLGMLLKRLRPSLRYGVMVHGVEVWKRLPTIKRRAIQHADLVTSVSEFTKAKLVDLNVVKPERIWILPNTIEWGDEAGSEFPVSSSRSPKSGIRLLSVCRLETSERYKGIDTVIEALPAVIARVPDLEYVVVGAGSDLERHRTLAAEKGISDRVHFLGSVDDATLRQCYEGCDVFVLPSAGEGFGIVFLEAMHHRKPVVAANSGAVPEVVIDGETGLLVDYENADQLGAAITKLCLDAELRNRLGAAGNRRLQTNFTFDHFKEKLREIIASALVGDGCVAQPTRAGADLVA
jgi:phosphatidylinositol alpha-1,6-mannosyltransferase